MTESWNIRQRTDHTVVWAESFSGELVVLAKPDNYDWWNIFDTTGRVVRGTSLGPFTTVEDGVERIQEDIPGIELGEGE